MPCTFEFDPENQLLRARLEGRITSDEALEHYRAASRWVLRTMAKPPPVAVETLSAVNLLGCIPAVHRLHPFVRRPCPRCLNVTFRLLPEARQGCVSVHVGAMITEAFFARKMNDAREQERTLLARESSSSIEPASQWPREAT